MSTLKEEISLNSLEDIADVSQKIVKFSDNLRVWAFEGEMGAGKTTLIRAICETLKVKDNVSSPTFSLVNEYETASGETLYHFDFYRIRNLREAADMGCEEYFYSGNYCFIEWPSKIDTLLPEHYLQITIELNSNSQRNIQLLKK
jgi:tRNA threonylcarbamoyladenosine biosynthesis protein TsaE